MGTFAHGRRWRHPGCGLGRSGCRFATYRTTVGPYDALAGDILAYFAFFLVLAGIAVAAIGIKGNWRADQSALAVNTAAVLAVELGLVLFLLLPGHLSFAEASPGFILALIGIVAGGIACNANHEVAHADG